MTAIGIERAACQGRVRPLRPVTRPGYPAPHDGRQPESFTPPALGRDGVMVDRPARE